MGQPAVTGAYADPYASTSEPARSSNKTPIIIGVVVAIVVIIAIVVILFATGVIGSTDTLPATDAPSTEQPETITPESSDNATTPAPEQASGLEAAVADGSATAYRVFADNTVYVLSVNGADWNVAIGEKDSGDNVTMGSEVAIEGVVNNADSFSGGSATNFNVTYPSDNSIKISCIDTAEGAPVAVSGTYYATMSEASQHAESGQPLIAGKKKDDYIIPGVNTRYLTEADIQGLSDWDLYLGRNEIYARHGRQFKNQDLQQYFGSQDWYNPQYSPEAFDAMDNMLNDFEKKNAELILSLEHQRNSPYL